MMRLSARRVRVVALVALASAVTLYAGNALGWTGPSASPPSSNVAAPVNVGAAEQVKDGAFGASGIVSFGNMWLNGSDRYLNFGGTAGDTGYGIRDSSGTLQFKNSGGSWTAFGSSGSLTWLASGNNIYNTNSGNVGIGVASPGQKLDVSGTVRATAFLYSSDARLKTHIIALTRGLDTLQHLSPVSFVWNAGTRKGEGDIGFIAQNVEGAIPEAVYTDVDGMKSVDYVKIVPVLVRALQEQEAEIEALKDRISALEH